MVAVRVHLEANTLKNGLLQVVPASHKGSLLSGRKSNVQFQKAGL